MSTEVGEVKAKFFRLIKNTLILGFILVFFTLLRAELISLINLAVSGLSISGDLIFNMIILLFVVYFGYYILIEVKYFLDLASKRLGRKNQGNLQSVTYDIAGLISLILASFLLSPIVVSISGFGDTAAKIVNVLLLAIGLLIVYHLANQLYMLLKKQIGKLALETKQFRTSRKNKKTEENA